jgi:Amt family ammonium transporter
LVGLLADPKMIQYLGNPGVSGTGLFYGHPKQLLTQAGAALTIIVWDGAVTFVLLKGIGLVIKLRMTDEELLIGDAAVHGEEAYPSDDLVSVSAQAALDAAGTPDGEASDLETPLPATTSRDHGLPWRR